jgi:carbon storage regulator
VLIITRRAGERIMLGDDVVIEVIEVAGSSVRVGIQAPKSLPVYREEIWRAMADGTPGGASAKAD